MIEVSGLTKRYPAGAVVEGVSFHVKRGELLVLVGGPGSGKTTTLKMVNRLLEPSAGTVLIDGERASTVADHVLRRSIGYAFQRVGLFPHMTIEQNIGVTPSLLGWSKQRIHERVAELLALVELEPALASRFPDALSGGQQQRVGLARALAARPKILLLDEPFGALDPLTRDRLQQSFRNLQAELGMTSIFVTHDMVEALLLADRIAVLREGRLIQIGEPKELLARPADSYVAQLFETPRRQARRFDALQDAARA
jgi:osmoprotectant transport system ATP-binding protein